MIPTLEWTDAGVRFLDQTKLPLEETYVLAEDYRAVAEVIRTMIVRGAPAIGVSAAMGVALGLQQSQASDIPQLDEDLKIICDTLAATRPTAVNLFWGIERIRQLVRSMSQEPCATIPQIQQAAVAEARRMYDEDIAACRAMGAYGAALMPRSGGVLTHCNAGALATCGYGTALGVIRAAVERGHKLHVFADETRPFLQGARLTAWELLHDHIPTTVLCDNMAASQMRAGKIQAVIVGADRIAANGDVANKIGTYGVAVLAKEHGIPFYVAAPWSTIDMATPTGEQIPIEERAAKEVTHFNGKQIAPNDAEISNPAFDITPAKYVTAIITELGVLHPPYDHALRLGTEQTAHPVAAAK
ncbi:MAG: S-methyl-5-thioribose-1-phosphate isomerase [Acidobacteriaceae bacterium]